jgi:hypothetical protein
MKRILNWGTKTTFGVGGFRREEVEDRPGCGRSIADEEAQNLGGRQAIEYTTTAHEPQPDLRRLVKFGTFRGQRTRLYLFIVNTSTSVNKLIIMHSEMTTLRV